MSALWHIKPGDALEVLRTLPTGYFDACLTDPPYGLGLREPTVEDIIAYLTGVRSLDTGGDFMGEEWELPPVEVWNETSRVLKPGAPALVFSGTRTFDLVAIGLRAARFESRDSFCWLYSSGYPHSLDVSKAIDAEAGAVRPVIGTRVLTGNAAVSTKDKGGTYGVNVGTAPAKTIEVTGPATEDAARYSGYGTTLKPAWEPILLVRKPLDGTVAHNVLTHGAGALNLDGCRIGFANEADEGKNQHADHDNGARENNVFGAMERPRTNYTASGRWPPNVCLSHTERCTPTGSRQVEATSIHGEITGGRPSDDRQREPRHGLRRRGWQGDRRDLELPARLSRAHARRTERHHDFRRHETRGERVRRPVGHDHAAWPLGPFQSARRHGQRLALFLLLQGFARRARAGLRGATSSREARAQGGEREGRAGRGRRAGGRRGRGG